MSSVGKVAACAPLKHNANSTLSVKGLRVNIYFRATLRRVSFSSLFGPQDVHLHSTPDKHQFWGCDVVCFRSRVLKTPHEATRIDREGRNAGTQQLQRRVSYELTAGCHHFWLQPQNQRRFNFSTATRLRVGQLCSTFQIFDWTRACQRRGANTTADAQV